MNASLESWLETARAAADAAAAVHVDAAGSVLADHARQKGTADFVSEVDEAAQRAALAVIHTRHPDHLVLAEEDDAPPALPTDGTPLWVVDPLDGTTNFLHGHPMHVASVGLAVGGAFVVGAVTCGPTGERWWAAQGMGAFKALDATSSAQRITTSNPQSMARALIGTGFPFRDLEYLDVYMNQFLRVIRSTAGARRGGAAALDLCYVAEGRFDGFWEQRLSPWDFAAGVAIIREAGGMVTRVDGTEVTIDAGSILAGANPAFTAELKALLDG